MCAILRTLWCNIQYDSQFNLMYNITIVNPQLRIHSNRFHTLHITHIHEWSSQNTTENEKRQQMCAILRTLWCNIQYDSQFNLVYNITIVNPQLRIHSNRSFTLHTTHIHEWSSRNSAKKHKRQQICAILHIRLDVTYNMTVSSILCIISPSLIHS